MSEKNAAQAPQPPQPDDTTLPVDQCLTLIEASARAARELRASATMLMLRAEKAPKIATAVGVQGDMRRGGPIAAQGNAPEAAQLYAQASQIGHRSETEVRNVLAMSQRLVLAIQAENGPAEHSYKMPTGPAVVTG